MSVRDPLDTHKDMFPITVCGRGMILMDVCEQAL